MNSVPTATATTTATRYRWIICALLFAATSINYIDRQILSLLKPTLDLQLGWTDTQYGAVNSCFQASYGLSLFFFGWFVDRYGAKIGYTVSIAAWSVAAIGHGLVNSIGGFFGARVALGLGEGGNFPSAIKATTQWFPQKERALATSLFNSGANVGAIAAPALVPPIAAALGWHWAFIFAGVAGFLWLTLWLPLFDEPEKSRRVSAAELAFIESDAPDAVANLSAKSAGANEVAGASTVANSAVAVAGSEKVTWRSVVRHREAWSFIAAKFLTDPVWWFFLTWLPDFFKKTRGLDIKSSWILLVSIYTIVTILSISGGWLTGHLAARGWSITRARKTGMLLFALCVLPLLVVTRVSDWTAVLIIGLAGASHQAWSATLYTTVSDMFPKRAVATLIGIGSAAGSIGGIGFPILVGALLDHFKTRGAEATGYTLIFSFCSVAYLIALVIHHLLAPRFEKVADFQGR